MTYMGDARYNMGNSLMVACAKMGMHFTACTTAKYFPANELVAECENNCSTDRRQHYPDRGCEGRHQGCGCHLHRCMGIHGRAGRSMDRAYQGIVPYQVNKAVMDNAGEQAIFMHCLPAFHDLKTKIGAQMW